jgi:glutaredoxin
MDQVKFYFHPTCPWCRAMRKILEDHHIPFQGYNIGRNLGALREWIVKTNHLEVPWSKSKGTSLRAIIPIA